MKKFILKLIRMILISLGILFAIAIILAFTPAPFFMHYNLGKNISKSDSCFIPEYIVMLGAGGMPESNNLMRLHYVAEFAGNYKTPVIILHPADSATKEKMLYELSFKGINRDDVTFSTDGTNTHTQVLALKKLMPELTDKKLLIITSPEHLRRTQKCFIKQNFNHIYGKAAFNSTIDFDLSLDKTQLDDDDDFIIAVNNSRLRYTFWNYLKLEITCFREYFALLYYKINAWI
jgi:uncharacterized SAM-binding protein YcdF (DUF218 family)